LRFFIYLNYFVFFYSEFSKEKKRTSYLMISSVFKVPSRVKISDVRFEGIRGTSATQVAVKIVCSRGLPCQNVSVEDINLVYNGKEGSSTSLCANVKPQVSGKVFPATCTPSA
jgi:galacturan 1,4-alpha-galacturonidase